MSAIKPIVFWNQETHRLETEKVYGDSAVRFLYGVNSGRKLSNWILSKPLFSEVIGRYQSSSFSKLKIPSFVKRYEIPMDQYESGPFPSFNAFFIRKFKDGKRVFTSNPNEFPAPAEARYLAFEKMSLDQTFPVKGKDLSAETILGNAEKAEVFKNGPVVIARLCPVDYHRYHYPDNGMTLDAYTLGSRYHSVNPVALQSKSEIFATNYRRISLLKTKNFGQLAFVEVGAMCVGKIVQTHNESQSFKRGDEKGYFLFGASTLILFGENGRWRPDLDIVAKTKDRIETFVKLGKKIGILP